jgi:hypothetical protein
LGGLSDIVCDGWWLKTRKAQEQTYADGNQCNFKPQDPGISTHDREQMGRERRTNGRA